MAVPQKMQLNVVYTRDKLSTSARGLRNESANPKSTITKQIAAKLGPSSTPQRLRSNHGSCSVHCLFMNKGRCCLSPEGSRLLERR